MYTHPQQGSLEDAKMLRIAAGQFLRLMREARGKTQREVAEDLGLDYYTMISQIETGRVRVPPTMMEAYARSLGEDPRELTRTLMRYYDPLTYSLLFAERGDK